METIWTYLDSLGIPNTPRSEKHTVHLALESEKMNPTQISRMASLGYLSEKLDGVYSLVTYINGEVRHWGRSGKAQSNCELLDLNIRLLLRDSGYKDSNFVFISEITSEDPLAKLSGFLAPTRVNAPKFYPSRLKDNFHDVLTLKVFIKGSTGIEFGLRQSVLQAILLPIGIKPVEQIICNYEAAKAISLEWIKEGKEGGVYAQDSIWTSGARNESLIKIKERLSFDVTVVGVCSGKQGSKYEHTLGKLVVVFRAFGKPDGKLLEIPISGMTDAQRDLWYSDSDLIIGKCVKMDAKSFTETGNLREPRFKEVRNDKSSQFPVELLEGISIYTKGKSTWTINDWA